MNHLCVADKETLPKTKATSHLVPLRSSGSGAPLFCLHPSGGDVGVYRKLVRNLPKTISVVGIQSRLLAGDAREFDSIDTMVEVYAKLIDQCQPEGPIRLLGFSFGGFLATAVSNQLMKYRRDVSFIGLIDSDLRWINDEASTKKELELRLTQLSLQFQKLGVFQSYSIEKTQEDVRGMIAMSFGSQDFDFEQWLEFLQVRGYISQESPQTQLLCRFAARFITHCNLLTQFNASAFATPLNIWWPTEPATDEQARREAWEAYTPYPIVERALSGGHYSIMRMPTVAALAKDVYMRMKVA